ncbi:DUF5825 family protein [Spongiactinospora sp. TRM90649]|uniref:DUF5825 family protein n=1 Tax=Spongiactinospora sp. TRM90649 TaxID=3031114 RepID=UPI0023F6F6C2|nr:DUF5825 family protein [Spongiactinospora sp. TRM90649]MDF5754395.1 DUF5825 family protein [Spongiactinospora sp. TRM90649]
MNGVRTVDWGAAGTGADAVAWLRDGLSDGDTPRWRVAGLPEAQVPLLLHLPPPESADGPHDRWRSGFRLGLCYYRRGPGFVQVKDVREPERSASFVLDVPELVEVFLRCLRPTRAADVDPDAAGALLDERLLLRLGDRLVTLPYHMRRWPVPAMAV